jgi:hypothetical protein
MLSCPLECLLSLIIFVIIPRADVLAQRCRALYDTYIVSTTLKRAPERGARIDGFVRGRWAFWLRRILGKNGLNRNQLARILAEDPNNVQTWPRALVTKWLNAEVTVSADRAYKVGTALLKLGAKVSGPEAVFAAGHVPAFIGFLDLLATEDGGAPIAAGFAVLPWAAYAFGATDTETLRVEGSTKFMLPVAQDALGELSELSVAAPDLLNNAWSGYQRGRSPRHSGTYFDYAIDRAYRAAAEPTVPPGQASKFAFSYLADWLAGLHLSSSKTARLWKYVDSYEEYLLIDRREMRASMSRFSQLGIGD